MNKYISINVAYSFDKNFYKIAGVAIASLLYSAKNEYSCNIYCLISDDISIEEQNILINIVKALSPLSSVTFLNPRNIFVNSAAQEGYSNATYFHLMLPWLLPEENRILYLDTDTIVNGSILDLYDLDFAGNLLAGFREYINLPGAWAIYEKLYPLSMKRMQHINSGVLLMNLEGLRKARLKDAWIKMSQSKKVGMDQNILNSTCLNKISFFPMKYNYFTGDYFSSSWFFDNKSRETIDKEMIANGIITNEEYLEATKNPVIYHYVLTKKPWNTKVPDYDIWWFYTQFTSFNKKELIKPMICSYPFDQCEILPDGRVVFCCLDWIKQNCIGNIFEDSFENVWNSHKAQAIRKSVLDGNYSYCDRKICDYPLRPIHINDRQRQSFHPKIIKLSYDNECNLSCIICRQKSFKNTDDDLIRLNETIDKVLPALKQAKKVFLSGQGDPFASRHYRLLIKRIVQTYPDMKFGFQTNGTCCSRETLESLGLIGKIDSINISLSATTKETWLKFTGGTTQQYDMLLRNINELSEMKKNGELKILTLDFVITSINFMELIDFIRFVNNSSLGGFKNKAYVWGVRPDDTALAIHNPKHKDYPKLKKVLENPIFNSADVFLYPEIKKIREEILT